MSALIHQLVPIIILVVVAIIIVWAAERFSPAGWILDPNTMYWLPANVVLL